MSDTRDQRTNENQITSSVTIFETSTMYWKLCTGFLVLALIIAVASHGGPSQANASENLLSVQYQQRLSAGVYEQDQQLTIGGFESINEQAMFVIVDQDGQRVGVLPMEAASID